MRERGLAVDHVTIFRWVRRHAPEINERMRPHLKIKHAAYPEAFAVSVKEKVLPRTARGKGRLKGWTAETRSGRRGLSEVSSVSLLS